jgi:nucleotide-binding universal stress UspA family protein
MTIRKILFPTRFREYAFNALESLFVLKKAGLREIILYYVIPRDDVGFVPFGGYLKKEEERLREEAKVRFENWQKALSEQGIENRVIIEVGDPVPQILSVAEREKVDLIVVGKKKGTFFENSFVGTETLKIVTRSTIPTLASKHMVEYECDGECVLRTNKDKFTRPLFPTDFSKRSEKVLNLLLSLKDIIEKVYLCHIIETRDSKGHSEKEWQTIELEKKKLLSGYADALRSAGLETEELLGAGNVSDEAIRISRGTDATMIIMGTTRKDRLHEFFQGSDSHRVTQLSELPTLLVP